MRCITALALVLLATATMAGEIYTWKDAGGKVHYSDSPPPGVDARKMSVGTSSVAPEGSAADQRRSLAEKDADFRKRKAEAEKALAKADKDKAQAEQRAKGCQNARNQLRALEESGQRVFRYNDKGERSYLDDKEREAASQDARKAVQDLCN